MRTPLVLTLSLLIAECNAFSQTRVGRDNTVWFLEKQQLESTFTGCVRIGVVENKGYAPSIQIGAEFDKAVSGMIEVNGRAVETKSNSASLSHGEQYVKDGDTFKITLTVKSPVSVRWFWVGGDKAFGVVEVRQVDCSTISPPPRPSKK